MNTTLTIKADRQLVSLQNDDILFIQARGDYLMFYTPSKRYMVHSTMRHLEAVVNPQVFVRAHRSYIVNVAKVSSINGARLLINDNTVPISKVRMQAVMEKMRA